MKRFFPTKAQILCGLAIITIFCPMAAAQSYKVNHIEYHNRGAYTACIDLSWRNASGEVNKLKHWVISQGLCALAGQNVTLKLEELETDRKPKPGDEVWAVINIDSGDHKNCRKNGRTFHYYKGGGAGTVKYKTKGTVTKNNHCSVMSCNDCAEAPAD